MYKLTLSDDRYKIISYFVINANFPIDDQKGY